MKKLRAIVIEDELNSRELLVNLLSNYCSNVEVVGTGDDVNSGIHMIRSLAPDVVFLDIEIPGGDGFSILDAIKPFEFSVIFVTGYDQYALRAFRYAALDYILKPISLADLHDALSRILPGHAFQEAQVRYYRDAMETKRKMNQQIIIRDAQKVKVLKYDDILFLEASGNYVFFQTRDGKKHIAMYTLRHYEDLLPPQYFRVHKSVIINLEYVREFNDGRVGRVTLSGGFKIPVAARRIQSFKKLLLKFNRS